MIMKIWVDDLRPTPDKSYIWAKSTNETIHLIEEYENKTLKTGELPDIILDLDHDSGEFFKDGGDYIHILDWLEATNRSYSIKLHTMNPVGMKNMLAIIQRNNWKLLS